MQSDMVLRKLILKISWFLLENPLEDQWPFWNIWDIVHLHHYMQMIVQCNDVHFIAQLCWLKHTHILSCLVVTEPATNAVSWLIRRKARGPGPGQISKQNAKNIFSAIYSQQISGINSESKIKLRSESTLNCRSRHLCLKLTHTTKVVWETRPIIQTEGL